MKLTAAYQLCDHGLSLVPVTAEKKSQMPDFFFLHVVITIDASEGFFTATPTTQATEASLGCSECRSFWCLQGLINSTSTVIVFQLIVAIQQDKLVEFLR